MVESLIENVHREDLKPIEQAKAILEVFKEQEDFLLRKKCLSLLKKALILTQL